MANDMDDRMATRGGRPATRRAVLAGTAAAAAAGTVATPALAAAGDGAAALPPGFVWGVAASAPQTEGSAGRGRSIWDEYAEKPGRIADGSDMAVGNAFELRYAEDVGIAADAGLRAFRFSIAWPRVQPGGSGPADEAGLDLYDRMVDAMLARGVEPWPTLFHWDLPAELPRGWLNRDTALRFGDYAGIVGRRLGDRVRNFVVLNEPNTVALAGHAFGNNAPGLKSRAAFAAATHHQNLAQGLGFAALRAAVPPGRGHRFGTAPSLSPTRPVDGDPDNAEAAAILDDVWNRAFLDPLLGRPYPERFAPDMERLIREGDMPLIAARPDFLGVNYYTRLYAKAAPRDPLRMTQGEPPRGLPRTDSGWSIEPDGLREVLRDLRDRYGNLTTYVTETGAAFPDPAPSGGTVDDWRRVDFLRRQLRAIADAAAEGCDVRGLFCWTLTDNWEWGRGFEHRFGLVHVDRVTLRRTPKASLAWLGRCARANAVV